MTTPVDYWNDLLYFTQIKYNNEDNFISQPVLPSFSFFLSILNFHYLSTLLTGGIETAHLFYIYKKITFYAIHIHVFPELAPIQSRLKFSEVALQESD